MRRMGMRLVAFSILVLPFSFSTTAMADCITQLLSTGQPCDGCTEEGVLATRHDETCRLSPPAAALGAAPMVFLGSRIIERAKHGIAATSGNATAYSPNKGYVGPDDFVVERSFEWSGRSGKFKIHYHVTV